MDDGSHLKTGMLVSILAAVQIVEGNNYKNNLLEMSRNLYLYNLTLRHQAIFAEALNRSHLISRGIEHINSGRKVNSWVGSLSQFLI